MILAREAGLELELSDVPVSSLVPAELESGTSANFMEKLSEFDNSMAQRAQAAADKVCPLLRLTPHPRHTLRPRTVLVRSETDMHATAEMCGALAILTACRGRV